MYRRPELRQWAFWPVALVVVCTAMLVVRSRLDKAHVALAFLLVVLGGSAAGGRALGVALSGAAFLVFNWFFVQPYDTLIVADPLDWLILIAFLVTGIVAAQLLERQRRQADIAGRRAAEIDRLATLGAETLNAPRAQDALQAIATVIRQAMATDRCEIYRCTPAEGLELVGRSPDDATPLDSVELLSYTVSRREAASQRPDGTFALLGRSLSGSGATATNSVSQSLVDLRALGLPLSVRDSIVGALRISASSAFTMSDDDRRVLGALSYYAALGVERLRLAGAEEEADSLRRADILKDTLLASVTHDLRTPLTAIKGIANEIWRGGDPLRAHTIEEEADRLNALVEDLLELSELNAGRRRVTMALNTADDVIGAALERVEAAHGTGRIDVDIANVGEILTGEFDFAHTMRALTNLLENALKYSPAHTRVLLRACQRDQRLMFIVEDEGRGIPAADAARIFQPFQRGSDIPDGVRGTGLGLSIARQLAEAQQGTLTHEARAGNGSRFILTLRAAPLPSL